MAPNGELVPGDLPYGWGGPSTPLNADLFIDRRFSKASYCNQAGVGPGERPAAAPATGIDAYEWIKPSSESDGSAPQCPAGPSTVCGDSTWARPPRGGNIVTGALASEPAAGTWFPAQSQQLMRNA